MRLKTIHKELSEAIDILKTAKTKQDYIKGLKKLIALRTRIEENLKKEEESKKEGRGKKLQHLMGWYLKLWEGKPPESLKFMNPNAIIAKHLKELIQIYERNGEDIETLKKDYEHFRETWRKGNRGILHFRSVLPILKQSKSESWVSPENKHDESKYKVIDADELWDEDDKLSF